MLSKIKAVEYDSILHLMEVYRQDPNPRKVNLSAGVYQNGAGRTPVLNGVKIAEQRLLAHQNTKIYLPNAGLEEFGRRIQELLFGPQHEILIRGRACTAHTPGGTCALRMGAEFLKKHFPKARVWLSQPTWLNHRGIFATVGLPVREYRYYDPVTKGLDFEGLLDSLRAIPPGDIVLLQGSCHNPTGVEPSPDQWETIAQVVMEQNLLPFVDLAYQGLGQGLDEDAQGLRALARPGAELLVASSCSKNFSLYNERVGALTLVAADADSARAAFTHIKLAIRVTYSNPPAHGELVVLTILNDPSLRVEWKTDLSTMRQRILAMRTGLVKGLRERGVTPDYSFILAHKGMFSLTDLTAEQIQVLRERFGIYVVGDGRINCAGLTHKNLDYVCDAFKTVTGPHGQDFPLQ